MSEAEPGALSSEQKRALACVLDTLIPPSEDGRLPGAGELGLVTAIEAAMAEQPALGPLVLAGLEAFEELIRGIGLEAFAALPVGERSAVLHELDASQPAFVPSLVFPLYATYYQQPRVVVALGMEARPPHPKGYEMAPTDSTLLDPVRQRKPIYREC